MYRLKSKSVPFLLRDSATGRMVKVRGEWVEFVGLPVGVPVLGDNDIAVETVRDPFPSGRVKRGQLMA